MALQGSKEITPRELSKRLKKSESVLIVDVREPDEWAAGHIAGSKHIPLGQLMAGHHKLDPKRETIIVCRSGRRSGLACELLSEKGFNVVNLTGGLLAWTGRLSQD
ncbi:MAG: rhodanese-like domain-containing protein [Gorillibacterium sp.]|nr:rhodanese-like domain-containing protein [Gorillibacterium sp.]